MPATRKRKRRKKVRYHALKLKLTSTQRKSLMNYCQARRTTPTKLIKKMIRPALKNYSRQVPEKTYITENQLDLFEVESMV
jgi:hypothetical protein